MIAEKKHTVNTFFEFFTKFVALSIGLGYNVREYHLKCINIKSETDALNYALFYGKAWKENELRRRIIEEAL